MCIAYNLYKHCTEGTVDPDWKVVSVSGPKFCQRMSLQMVQYRSSNMQYPGDSRMRKVTQMKKRKRGMDGNVLVECDDHIKSVSYSKYINEKQPKRGKSQSYLQTT